MLDKKERGRGGVDQRAASPRDRSGVSAASPRDGLTAGKLTLGGLKVFDAKDVPTRMAILIWGPVAVGKTTYAMTAPGKKLLINHDPEGKISILHRDDVEIVEIDNLSLDETFKQLQNDDPLGLDSYLAARPDIGTVVLDSATMLAWRALQKAVRDGVGSSRGNFRPTIEAPGMSAYGGRNNIMLVCITGLLKVTAKHNRHCIIITHEADPKLTKDGDVDYYNMMLGGQTVTGFSVRLSEVWYMSVGSENERRLAVWSTRKRHPMKSRIFKQGESREFTLPYNAEMPDEGQEYTISDIYDRWVKGQWRKLEVPVIERKARKLGK